MVNTSGLAVKVGIFVVAGLLLLIGFSLQVANGLGGGDRYQINAYFDEVLGLNEGGNVFLGGVRIGDVSEIGFDSERRQVRVRMQIQDEYQLPADSVAAIRSPSFFTSPVVMIEYGTEPETLQAGGDIGTQSQAGLEDLIASVSEASEEAREMMSSFSSNQDGVLRDIQVILEENRDDIRQASQSLAEAGPKLSDLAENLNQMTEEIRGGQGTLGRLLNDDEMYEDLRELSNQAREISTQIRDGEGTLSRLLYDDSLARTAEESFQQLSDAGKEVQRLLEGRQSQIDDAFASMENLGPKIEEAIANVEQLTTRLEKGEGTLGMLINDPALYIETRRALNQVTESFESSEEQGVVRSFVGILFGALI